MVSLHGSDGIATSLITLICSDDIPHSTKNPPQYYTQAPQDEYANISTGREEHHVYSFQPLKIVYRSLTSGQIRKITIIKVSGQL